MSPRNLSASSLGQNIQPKYLTFYCSMTWSLYTNWAVGNFYLKMALLITISHSYPLFTLPSWQMVWWSLYLGFPWLAHYSDNPSACPGFLSPPQPLLSLLLLPTDSDSDFDLTHQGSSPCSNSEQYLYPYPAWLQSFLPLRPTSLLMPSLHASFKTALSTIWLSKELRTSFIPMCLFPCLIFLKLKLS